MSTRIRRGDISRAGPYRELVAWVDAFLAGGGTLPAERVWAFYDERFDPRLFEIWTLAALANCLNERYDAPGNGAFRPLWRKDGSPIATWSTPYGRVELFFQRETSGLGLPGRWRIPSRHQHLRAIPDVVVRIVSGDGQKSWVILDCKLRRHLVIPEGDGPLDLPSEEVYKMLGYFEHLYGDSSATGALVYYTPGGVGRVSVDRPEPRERPGRLELIGVDPAAEDADLVLCNVADLVSRLIGEPGDEAHAAAHEAAEAARAEGGDEPEARAAFKQRLLLEVLKSYAAKHEEQMPAVQKLTQAWFEPHVWDALDLNTRRMVLSAELYGSQQLSDLDHSGPLLGLCAACERELNLRVFRQVAAMFPNEKRADGNHVINEHATLGAAIETLHRGRRVANAIEDGESDPETRVLSHLYDKDQRRAALLTADFLLAQKADLQSVARLVKRLRQLNTGYRRPSAHDEVVEAHVWAEGRTLVLGDEGLLGRVVEAFPGPGPGAQGAMMESAAGKNGKTVEGSG